MSDAEVRKAVLARIPQAQYMNLTGTLSEPCHCIDDAHNDRYLAMGCSSRRAAWRAAYRLLNTRFAPRSTGETESPRLDVNQ